MLVAVRLSISKKILIGFAVVFLAFGSATIYAAWAVHTLGERLRLVALGYSQMRVEFQDQLALQAALVPRLLSERPDAQLVRDLAVDRNRRRARLRGAADRLAELRRALPRADARFLDGVARQILELERLYAQSERLSSPALAEAGGQGQRLAQVRAAEDAAQRILQEQSSDLYTKVLESAALAERYEARAVWMTVFLSVLAAGIGVLVLLLMQATLRPLRRLSEGAREIARGNYRQRVASSSGDEVGALGQEFNAMAAALEEREARLRRSEQLAAVGKMVAQITHEVRNPLSSIGLNAELLADEVAGSGSEAQTLARAIVKEVDRLTEITEQYLRFARLPEPRFERGDLSALCGSLLQFMAGDLAGRGVKVEAELVQGLPAVALDENQLRPAILNLVRNAAEAMAGLPPEARLLRVRTGHGVSGGQAAVTLEVADSGPGIPEEHRAKIFEPFFTTKQGGTGLGLALAHDVIVRHGGSLQVVCPPQGGTRFEVSLPVPAQG